MRISRDFLIRSRYRHLILLIKRYVGGRSRPGLVSHKRRYGDQSHDALMRKPLPTLSYQMIVALSQPQRPWRIRARNRAVRGQEILALGAIREDRHCRGTGVMVDPVAETGGSSEDDPIFPWRKTLAHPFP